MKNRCVEMKHKTHVDSFAMRTRRVFLCAFFATIAVLLMGCASKTNTMKNATESNQDSSTNRETEDFHPQENQNEKGSKGPLSSVRNRKSASSLAPIGASTRAFPLLTGLSAHAVHWTACVSAPRLGPRALRTLLIWFDNLWMHLRMYEHCPVTETVLPLVIHEMGQGVKSGRLSSNAVALHGKVDGLTKTMACSQMRAAFCARFWSATP